MTTDTATFAQPARQPYPDEARARTRSTVALNAPAAGMVWFGGWLFTIGFAHLTFWNGVLALVIWPYFLGVLARG